MTPTAPDELLALLLAASAPSPCRDLAAWKSWWRGFSPQWSASMDRAVLGGAASDRLAWAFAAGYQSAIYRLLPEVPAEAFSAVCITEAGGGHPRAIEARLEKDAPAGGFRLTGEKRFITGGTEADLLVVAARSGVKEGRNRIRTVLVDRRAGGVRVAAMPPLDIVPEMPHAVVRFDSVFVTADRVLPEDGYSDFIKPFRTIEDLHVIGGVLGYLFGTGRRAEWPAAALEHMLALVAASRSLGSENPMSPAVHLALAGVFRQLTRLVSEIEPLWDRTDADTARRWRRDRGLLSVGDQAREGRRTGAWRKLNIAGGA